MILHKFYVNNNLNSTLGQYEMICQRTWYTSLVILRILCIFLPGYIHPDEFFQTPEIVAGDIFHFEIFKPWEYNATWPCRSIVIPALVNGIPFAILKYLHNTLNQYGFNMLPINTITLLIAERLPFALFSFAFDFILFRLAKIYRRDPYPTLIVLSSSYTLLVYFTRPFSNATEAILLALCGYILQVAVVIPQFNKQAGKVPTTAFKIPSTKASLALGLVFALGSFTRITFVIYAFPIGCAYLYAVGTQTLSNPRRNILSKFSAFMVAILPLFVGLALSSLAMILIDSIYFGSLKIRSVTQLYPLLLNPFALLDSFKKGELVITPLNNVLYNSNKENLSLHGLHPWYLHLLVYTPLLLGPLAYLLENKCRLAIFNRKYYSETFLKTVFAYSVLFGITVLSLMPHQEARFLLPILFPVIFILSDKLKSASRGFWMIFVLFNILGFLIFGIFHQGGIIPVLNHVQHEINEPVFCSFYDEHIHCQYSYSPQDKGKKPLGHLINIG
ncbi:alpha 1,2 mannosyltransferase, variant 2 [Basidiobolus ranarum]|uniref:Mannosyltransferase n=1 Tax=Basidiobolus ranarum TaxID=34480 RepID=A0ABR2W5B7_9FUNG